VVGSGGWGGRSLQDELGGSRLPVLTTGFVTDEELVMLYSAAECLLFPSLAEGFGFPPLEAMACGTPVVAGDRPAIPEVVGDAALTVDPERPEAIADAVARVLGSPELTRELRERGLARSAGFTWAECARQTAVAYRKAVT
jgi:glycosyltransferase involved in cell wall biosynthesis